MREQWADMTGHVRDIEGIVTAFESPRRLQFDYRQTDWQRQTRVEILISEQDAGSRLYFQHSGWEIMATEADRSREVDAHAEKWEGLFKRFVRYCT